ncbi:MAG: hypothetical protein U5L01_14660 [Rheinheimera sp.]|nr:hypothetical protein [Rheinheimera sp.]
MERFNVLGGSLVYGHPFAATGTQFLITQTLQQLETTWRRYWRNQWLVLLVV